MTGFARAVGAAPGEGAVSWVWEVRSVNGKGLDVRLKVPGGFEAIEVPARQAIGRRIKRGNVNAVLTVHRPERPPTYRINEPLLTQLVAAAGHARALSGSGLAPARVDGLLAMKGVLEAIDDPDADTHRQARESAVLGTLGETLNRLEAARREEGARLAETMTGQLDLIADLTARAEALAATQPAALKARLAKQVAELLEASPALSEERLAQEAALLATRADVREELDRLKAHIAQARDLLADEGPKGRRLDFLCQEFNREANTLCSKSADVALTRLGMDMKATIDQLREQVQNVE